MKTDDPKTDGMKELLWAALMESDHAPMAARLKKATSQADLVFTLTQLEKEVLDAQVHRAIALFKAVLDGKRTADEFEQQCLKIQGLL